MLYKDCYIVNQLEGRKQESEEDVLKERLNG